MRCPIDGATLVITERSGVEIDYCPHCRGVWLDRGELDKIIARASEAPLRATPAPREAQGRKEDYKKSRTKRVSSFLDDLFDF